MNPRAIVDPRMMTRLERAHYRQTVTIQQSTPTRGADGSLVDSWANVTGLVDLVGQVSPLGGGERRKPDQAYLQATHRINLSAYQASIVERMRATSGGKTYDILLVEQPSQRDHTSLVVEIVE